MKTSKKIATRSNRVSRRVRATGAAFVLAASAIGVLAGPAAAVVNGTPAAPGSVPHQVSLQDAEGHICGGSIVNATTIVTAAHCLEGLDPTALSIRAGAVNLTTDDGQVRNVVSASSHPDYAQTGIGDIATLKLDRPLDFNADVAPIALATAAEAANATTGRRSAHCGGTAG